jgi:hypothetical protein
MPHRQILLMLVPAFFLACFSPGFGQDDPIRSVFGRRTLFLGPQIAYSARDAYIDVDEIQKSVAIKRSGLLTFGLAGGLRIPVSRAVRLQIGLNVDGGSATDDTLFTAETVTVRNFYYHAGLEPQVHFTPWHSRLFSPYGCLGAGVNCVWVRERTFLLHDPAQEILYTDRNYISDISASFDVSAGIGCDIVINKRLSISLNDEFRYLYPVSYKIRQDLPLYDMPYHEAQYGNVLSINICIALQ